MLLQPLTGEVLGLTTANRDDGTRNNQEASGAFTKIQFLILGYSPNAASNCSGKLSAVYKRHEDDEKQTTTHGERIREVEHSECSHILVFVSNGGMGERREDILYET